MSTVRLFRAGMRAGVAAGCLWGAAGASADTVAIVADRDNTLYESADPLFQKSNGKGVVLFSGRTAEPAIRRALVHFDLSVVPAGATINSVTLRLTLDQTSGGAQQGTVHRLLADWGEGDSNAGLPGGSGTTPAAGDATWLYSFYSTTSWTTAGGSFAGASATAVHDNLAGPKDWSSEQLAQDVRDWYSGTTANYGWVIVGNEAGTQSSRRYHSREAATASLRPVLIVDYTPCKADFDGTGFVDTDDFDAFVAAFEAGDDSADFDETGFVDTDDFDAFVHAFELGC